MFKHILQSVFTKGFVALVNFLLLTVSARYLGADSRGEINILILNIAIIQILNEIYTGYSIIYFFPKYDLKKIFFTGIIFTLVATSLGNAVFYFLDKQLPGFEWLSFVISLVVILNTFNCVIILGKEKIVLYNFLSLLQPFLFFCGLLISIFIMRIVTVEAYLFPMLFSFVAAFCISTIIALRLVEGDKKKTEYEHKPILAYGIICQLGVLLFMMTNKSSFYIFETKNEVGLYGTASSLIESILIIANGIAPVLLARVANTGNSEKNVKMTLAFCKTSFLLSLIAVAVLFLLPNEFFVFLLGKGFSNIKYYMIYYAPGIIIMSFISIINNYFSAVGKLKNVLLSNAIGFAATLLLAPFLIGSMGIKGAAITADIAYGVTAIAICIMFFKINRLPVTQLFSVAEDIKYLKDLVRQRKQA
jgi:O-antigen/teichoic acid export membrane protein